MPKNEKTEDEEDILKELAEKLKLDEETDSDEVNLSNIDFSQFTPSLEISEETSTPVLERIAGRQAGPVFVGGISQAPQTIPGEEKEPGEFKYVPGQNSEEEPKYIESDARITREPERVDFARVGREPAQILPRGNQQAFFEQASERRDIQSQSIERTWGAERLDTKGAGREDPFRRKETKYEKYKPKLPK